MAQTAIDLSIAKTIAKDENKLLLIYFHDECDRQNVISDQRIYDNFVLVNIDVTQQPDLATLYQVLSTPRLFIETINDDRLLGPVHNINTLRFQDFLSAFPGDYEQLNEQSMAIMNKDVAPIEYYNLGETYRTIARQTAHRDVRNLFYAQSKIYYKKTENVSESLELKELAKLGQLRLNAYQEKFQKVLKKLNKIEVKSGSSKVVEMIDFLEAFCYKSIGNTTWLSEAKEGITDPELLKELEM